MLVLFQWPLESWFERETDSLITQLKAVDGFLVPSFRLSHVVLQADLPSAVSSLECHFVTFRPTVFGLRISFRTFVMSKSVRASVMVI